MFTVEEAATLLMKAGAMINVDKLSDEQGITFQTELMKIQIALEDGLFKIASNSGEPSVLLIDRGLMDSKAYIGSERWPVILEREGWTNTELRDHRYDAIIHMVTAADGAEEFYDFENVARFETVEEAIERDKILRNAYLGHNQVYVIANA